MKFTSRLFAVLLASVILVSVSAAAAPQSASPPAARFELSSDDVLIDEPINIIVSGLKPGANVTIRVRGGSQAAPTSSATFVADADGRVDLTGMAPVKGAYKDVDPMGLF